MRVCLRCAVRINAVAVCDPVDRRRWTDFVIAQCIPKRRHASTSLFGTALGCARFLSVYHAVEPTTTECLCRLPSPV